MRIDRANGVIEIGPPELLAALQRTAAATEAMYLMLRRAFDELGYRRYEWKCDSFNEPSRRAAARLGFQRMKACSAQAVVYQSAQPRHDVVLDHRRRVARAQGRVRGVAPADNFDAAGGQRQPLSAFMPQSTFAV